MNDTHKLKLRIVMGLVAGLALFQLFFGYQDFYPFSHLIMFSTLEHKPLASKITKRTIVAIDSDGKAHTVSISKLFDGLPHTDDVSSAIMNDYIKRLRNGDQPAAQALTRLIETRLNIGPIVALRVDERLWQIDLEKFYGGQIDGTVAKKKPDRVKELVTVLIATR